jgi:RNA polymerase sigma-70 factor, ECF subfamily
MSARTARHDDALCRGLRSVRSTQAAGFCSSTKLDDSPEAARLTRLAVERAKQGDQEALRYLYVQYSNNIYGYVRSIVRADHDAEDVTQHVFAKLMTAIVKYDDRGIPFFAWLLRLARNVAIDHLRSIRTTPVEEVISADAEFEEELEDVMSIREAIATLPEDQRQVVFLRHVVGLSPGEIAAIMDRSEGSIHGLHHRGRRSLQQELSRHSLAPTATVRRQAQLVAA